MPTERQKPFVQCLISVASSDIGGVKFKLMLTIWTVQASNTNTNLIPWPGPQYMPDARTNSEPDTMDMQSSPVESSQKQEEKYSDQPKLAKIDRMIRLDK